MELVELTNCLQHKLNPSHEPRLPTMSIQEQQDNLLMSLAQRSGSLDGLLTTFFRFLHRNTDFYVVDPSPVRKVGFAPGQAESMVRFDAPSS